MMRIAYFTPLNPIRSGISHYSEELLPYLRRYFDIDIYIDEYKPTNSLILNNFRIQPYKIFNQEKSKYDLTIYHMGNSSQYHEYIYKQLIEVPGLVVLHDYIYFHFYSGITLRRGDVEGFREIMRYCYGDVGLKAAREVASGCANQFKFSMVHKIIDSSVGVIVHNDYVKKLAEIEAPLANIKMVPMGIEATNPYTDAYRNRIRRCHGFSDNDFIVASFGMITPHKRVDIALRAFSMLRRSNKNAKFLLVGELSTEYSIRGLIRELGIENNVIITGYVTDDVYQEYLYLTDFYIGLRYPTAGETSIAILRAMEAGLPVAVSNYAQFSEFENDCTIKVDLGDQEVDLLYEYMRELSEDRELRRIIGNNARKYIHERHNPGQSASIYYEFIEEIINNNNVHFNGDIVIEDAKSVFSDLGDGETRQHFIVETNNLLQDMGLISGKEIRKKSIPVKNNLVKYQYYGKRLLDYKNRYGIKATIGYVRDKVTKRFKLEKNVERRSKGKPFYLKCNEIFNEICVLADGRVVCSCCDAVAQHTLGHVQEYNLYEIFNGLQYQRIRYSILNDKAPGLCMNCALRNKKIRKRDRIVMSNITALQIEVTNACNLKCPECQTTFNRKSGKSRTYMKYDVFTDIIDQLKGPLKTVKFYNYGEPFLHKDCMKMLRYVKKSDPKIKILISTNGTKIESKYQKELVDIGVDKICFSIDGITQEAYEKYRVGGSLSEVITNMRGIIEYKKLKKKKKPQIIWQYILFNWNDSDVEIQRAKEMAVEYEVNLLLWILTHTPGASKRFKPDTKETNQLLRRTGFRNSQTYFFWETSVNLVMDNFGLHRNGMEWKNILKKTKKILLSF